MRLTVRAFVFDFDGVIANSEPLHFRAYRDVLAARHVTLSEADYYTRYLGYDDRGAFEAVASDRGLAWDAAVIARLIDEKAGRLTALEEAGDILFPGAADAITAAAATFPIAIASGALGHEIRRVLDRANLSRHFVAIVAAEDTPHSKPAPDPYLRAVALLRRAAGPLDPFECVAVEDSRWGLESARAAGLRTIGVAHTYDADALRPADLIIPSMLAFDVLAIQTRFP
jgi:beta-phosphoglucomutase-like phosphatase (HAD superfamily)